MRITIIALGKAGRGPEQQMIDDYLRRLPWDASVKEFEIKKPARTAELRKEQEAEKIISAIPTGASVIVLDERGKHLSSRKLAEKIDNWQVMGSSNLAIIIGGADGLSETITKRADLLLAFGSLTWPHMLVRAMLSEQIYRVWSILHSHPYHRD